jgi:hypothetical protein
MAKKEIKEPKAPVAKKTVVEPKKKITTEKTVKKTVKKEKKKDEEITKPIDLAENIGGSEPTAKTEDFPQTMPTDEQKEETPKISIEDEIIEFGDNIIKCVNDTYHYKMNKMVCFVELQNTIKQLRNSKFGIDVVRSANNLEAHIEISYGKVKVDFPRNENYKVF